MKKTTQTSTLGICLSPNSMPYKILLLTVISSLLIVLGSQAQSASISTQNADAIKNYDGVMGNFGYALNTRETMNVNYALTPKNPSTTAHLMLHTPEAMPLSAKIVDGSGKVVYSWTPETKSYLHNVDLNVSSLASGAYIVQLFMGAEAKSIFQFNFNKQ